MRYVLPLALGLLSLFTPACTGPNPAPASAPQTDDERSAIEARLLQELSPADDRAGRQRNRIINYAIDNAYDLRAAPEGYFYTVLTEGEFLPLAAGDVVTAHYRGEFLDGTVFDDSRRRGQPLRFRVGDLIEAWNLGLQRVRPGGSIRIVTPSRLGYGAAGLTGPRGDTLVPAHTELAFVIDDVRIYEE